MAAVPDTSHVFQLTKGAHRTDAAVERARHQFARRHLFPDLGNPVIHERRVQLPQMQVRVVPISPADEMPQLSAVAVLGLFRARARALLQETLQE